MHNLTKIKLFRLLLRLTYPLAVLFVLPFVLLKKRNPTQLFFFFDRYSIGGAQRVHLDILESVRDIDKYVYFTRKSVNTKLRDVFFNFPKTRNRDIHVWCDYLLFRLFSVHYFSFYVNRHPQAVVLSGNSTFFYDMLPFLNSGICKIELLHNFSYGKKGMEFFGLANYRYLDFRMVIDAHTSQNILAQYKEYNVPDQYARRVKVVEFGVPVVKVRRQQSDKLRILNAGRGGPQKRIWLVNKIAEYFISGGARVQFHFVGPMTTELSPYVKQHSIVYPEISDRDAMNELYNNVDAILLTSSFEGFPMVIKEAMAAGCIPIVTALPGNLTHLQNQENALLIHAIEDEAQVVQEGIEQIQLLLDRPQLKTDLSSRAHEYAKTRFDRERFLRIYRELLLQRKINGQNLD